MSEFYGSGDETESLSVIRAALDAGVTFLDTADMYGIEETWGALAEDGGVLATTRELGIGFVPYSPLGRGFLTGEIRSLDDVEPGDFRRDNPRFLR